MSHCSWPAGSVLLMSSQLEGGREGGREEREDGGIRGKTGERRASEGHFEECLTSSYHWRSLSAVI